MTNGIIKTSAVIECILSHTAAKYDPAATLSDGQIRELVRIGTTAPTSFHLRNWRFIPVRTPEAKARLSPIAWNQPAITEAAVTFIVCGQARSWDLDSTPMIGFDDEAVHREFGLAEDEVPVMLLSIGTERPGNWPQKPRRPVADVLDLV
jgi:nitroreductase